jgi:Arc/MetJ-type ribon-helix-helix transcriptional regulator
MLNISLPDQVQPFIEEQAAAAGFNSVNEYIYHLILREQERITQQKRVVEPLEDTPKHQVLADFRQAWHEAMTGQGVPVSQLWAELENE